MITRSETVTHHRFEHFDTDSLGENSRPVFAEDELLEVYAVDPGGSSEAGRATDSTVTTSPALYFWAQEVQSSPHSEWTVRGKRWKQDGDPAIWRWMGVLGTVIRLRGRDG